ncbi:MAG: urease accessory protein UreF [Actinomycetota bacterium]|nr:urease accessory protein UreF [Actinomycetota bacterium]
MSTSAGSALLLLADGRLPAGSHAHSGGLEEAVADGRVTDTADLAAYLAGRLATTGRVDAALAAAAWPGRAMVMHAEALARCPSPAWRAAGKAQGRALLRAGRRMWPTPGLADLAAACPGGLMWPVALGAVAAAARLSPYDAALVGAQASVTSPAWAATRLLGLDPFDVARCQADLADAVDAEAAAAVRWAATDCDIRQLPAVSAPLADIGAQRHATWEVCLFAS